MKRDKKAIINNVKKLIEKYGFNTTRLEINRFFKTELEKKKLARNK